MGFYFLLYIPLLWIIWALAFPMQAVEQVASCRLWLAQYVIRRLVRQDIKQLKQRFRLRCSLKGYPSNQINEVLNSQGQTILKRIETRYSTLDPNEVIERCN